MIKQSNTLEEDLRSSLRDIPDFPKPGIIFKDITPILAKPELLSRITDAFAERLAELEPDAIAGIESRGFLFASLIAQKMQLPMIPIRKAGKLPWKKKAVEYNLEYGTAILEIHEDALDLPSRGKKVAVIDDLLATGGTLQATKQLIEAVGGSVVAFAFLIELGFLKARESMPPDIALIPLLRLT